MTIAGSWAHYRARVLQYFQQLAVITPYAGTYATNCSFIHLQHNNNDDNDYNNDSNIYNTRLFILIAVLSTFVLRCIVTGSVQCRLNFPSSCSSNSCFFSSSSISLSSSLIQEHQIIYPLQIFLLYFVYSTYSFISLFYFSN